MIDPIEFLGELKRHGVSLLTGVPCSILAPLIAAAYADSDVRVVPAVSEGQATAIAAGYWLASGKIACVYLQNSGIGSALDPIASLLLPGKVPALLLVSHRGHPGEEDAPHHEVMGKITESLLIDVFGQWFDSSESLSGLSLAFGKMGADNLPTAYLVYKGCFGEGFVAPSAPEAAGTARFIDASISRNVPVMTRAEAISAILETIPEESAIISSVGRNSRELFAIKDRPRSFYVQGAMGHAADVALGMSLARPDTEAVILDGDGSLLMGMGGLSTIGAFASRKFLHILLDNGIYASTGGQRTVSSGVAFPSVAAACGYGFTSEAITAKAVKLEIATLRGLGPAFLRIPIKAGDMPGVGRPTLSPPEIALRFQGAACGR